MENLTADRIVSGRIEDEEGVLGCVLSGRKGGYEALMGLKSEMFYNPKNRTILKACLNIVQAGTPIDRLSVLDAVRVIEPEFNSQKIYDLLEGEFPIDVNSAIIRIKNRHKLDVLQKIATKVVKESPEITEPDKYVSDILADIYELELSSEKVVIREFKDVLDETHEAIKLAGENKGQIGLNVGIPRVNELIYGLQPGYLILIAGRPSIGKTALAVNFMEHITINAQKAPVLFISLEMSAVSLAKRILTGRSKRLSPRQINRGLLEGDDWIRLGHEINKLQEAPIYIADTHHATIPDIGILCKSAVARYGVEAVFIDYLQLITPPSTVNNRNEGIGFISRSLKGIAGELNIPVVALSQLSRLGDNVRPELSHLRDSGSLEQDADQVLFVFREKLKEDKDVKKLKEKYARDQAIGELCKIGQIIVAKARNEETGEALVEFKTDEIRYVELDRYRPTRGAVKTEVRSMSDYEPITDPIPIKLKLKHRENKSGNRNAVYRPRTGKTRSGYHKHAFKGNNQAPSFPKQGH